MPCGHSGCVACLSRAVGERGCCPVCRRRMMINEVRAAPSVDLLVGGVRCKCANVAAGCPWSDSFGKNGVSWLAHQNVCAFEQVACQLCNQMFPRTQLSRHATQCPDRHVTCCHCSTSVKAKDLSVHLHTASVPAAVTKAEPLAAGEPALKKQRLQKQCELSQTPLPCSGFVYCPNRCYSECKEEAAFHLAGSLGSHLLTCPLQVVGCSIAGCDWRGPRQDLKLHREVDAFEHTRLLAEELSDQKADVLMLTGRLKQTKAELESLSAKFDLLQSLVSPIWGPPAQKRLTLTGIISVTELKYDGVGRTVHRIVYQNILLELMLTRDSPHVYTMALCTVWAAGPLPWSVELMAKKADAFGDATWKAKGQWSSAKRTYSAELTNSAVMLLTEQRTAPIRIAACIVFDDF
jgi:hypothetical protein